MATTGIEWATHVWNPASGCDKVSRGCDNCYALTMAKRLKAMGQPDYQTDGPDTTSGPGFGVALHPARLTEPFRWRKPRRVFVDSMGDLFHDQVPDAYIAAVWTVMHWTSSHARSVRPRHTYIILTKRHARMRSWVKGWGNRDQRQAWVTAAAEQGWCDGEDLANAPFMAAVLPSTYLGVSVEDQKRGDLRIPALQETPAAVRVLSCEPLLGPLSLEAFLKPGPLGCVCNRCGGLGWVIAGGESGKNARPMHPDWARTLRDQCTAASVPFFFKQAGSLLGRDWGCSDYKGADQAAWPADLRVQECPAVTR